MRDRERELLQHSAGGQWPNVSLQTRHTCFIAGSLWRCLIRLFFKTQIVNSKWSLTYSDIVFIIMVEIQRHNVTVVAELECWFLYSVSVKTQTTKYRAHGPVLATQGWGQRLEARDYTSSVSKFQRLYNGEKELVFTFLPRDHSCWRSFRVKSGKLNLCVVPSSMQNFKHLRGKRCFVQLWPSKAH